LFLTQRSHLSRIVALTSELEFNNNTIAAILRDADLPTSKECSDWTWKGAT